MDYGRNVPYILLCTQPGDRFSRSPYQQMYVHVLQNVLCRKRICISSFADASQVLIPMDGILHVQMKNKHSASSKHPIDGILRDLWRHCHPMDGKMKTTSSAFTDQPRLCHRKHCNLLRRPWIYFECSALASFSSETRKVSRFANQTSFVPTRPLHVTSLKDSFLFYYCVPRKT